MIFDAFTRSVFSADTHRAKTASAEKKCAFKWSAADANKRTYECDRHAKVERRNCRPFAGAFLAGRIAYQRHKRPAVGVAEAKNVCGDFDEKRVELAFIPLIKNVGELVVAEAEATLQHIERLSNQLPKTKRFIFEYLLAFESRFWLPFCLEKNLHVAIFDSLKNDSLLGKQFSTHIVHHLDEMARTRLAEPIAARLAFTLRGCGLEDGLNVRPRLRRTARHKRRSVARAIFAATNAAANKMDAFGCELFVTPLQTKIGLRLCLRAVDLHSSLHNGCCRRRL